MCFSKKQSNALLVFKFCLSTTEGGRPFSLSKENYEQKSPRNNTAYSMLHVYGFAGS